MHLVRKPKITHNMLLKQQTPLTCIRLLYQHLLTVSISVQVYSTSHSKGHLGKTGVDWGGGGGGGGGESRPPLPLKFVYFQYKLPQVSYLTLIFEEFSAGPTLFLGPETVQGTFKSEKGVRN